MLGIVPIFFRGVGVCRDDTEEETYRQLCALAAEEVEQLRQEGKTLPPAATRAMRDAVPA